MLRAVGLRGEIHPHDAFAFAFPDRESCLASAQRDRDNHGNDVHGPWETEAGFVSVVDIRPQLAAMGGKPTDPSRPDDLSV